MILAGMILLLAGCKKDFSTAGFHTIKDENFQFKVYQAHIKTYSEPVERVLGQNPSPLNLGVYEHPAFGLSYADVLIQFNTSSALGSLNFRNADSILFVELRIPYFSHKNEELSTDADPVYELDSIFGNGRITVEAYTSEYYLYPYDPDNDLISLQQFYSDFDFLSHTGNLLGKKENFYPSPAYLVDTLPSTGYIPSGLEDDEITISGDTLPPHLVIPLDTIFFRQKFFDRAGLPFLTDNELFKNYFRGIYLHSVATDPEGNFMFLDVNNIQLVLGYRYAFRNNNDTPSDYTDDFIDHGYEKIILKPAAIIEHYEHEYYPSTLSYLENPDKINGEDKIFMQGNASAMGVAELFTPEELYRLRNNNWMINQANLRFYFSEQDMAGIDTVEYPPYLYIYKKSDNSPIADLISVTEDGYNLNIDKVLKGYNGTLNKDEERGLYYYEINITRHIRNILRKDSANVPLGIRISSSLRSFLEPGSKLADPDAHYPFGVVLQGNRSADMPVEFLIYYTEPEEE